MKKISRQAMRYSLLGLATTLLLSAGIAGAEEADGPRNNPFEIGVFGGGHFYERLHGLGRFSESEPGLSPDHGGIFGLRLSFNLNEWIGAELEGAISPTRLRDDQTNVNVLAYRAQLIATLYPYGYVRPFVVAGFGALSSFPGNTDYVPRDTDGMFHLGLGAKFPINDDIGLRLDGRILAPGAIASDIAKVGTETHYDGPDYEILLACYLGFGGAAPLPPPPPPPPPPVDEDPDRDGILGAADKCPNEPEDRDGFDDTDGCPDLDNDLDGIPDVKDKCPNEPETKNSYQDDDGCPDEVPAAVKKFTGVIQGINFKTNSAEITKGSNGLLNKAVRVLVDYPDVRMEISGHTDNVGKEDFNKDLSQRRAESVKAYFVGKGIQADRLTAVGYGMDKPITSNKTKSDKAKNRRTEFQLIGSN